MAIIAIATLVAGNLNQSFTGFPKGYDAYGHMSKIKFLVNYFPNVDWNYEWYSGQLYSQGSFPALLHYAAGLLVAFLGMSPATALVVLAAVSFLLIGWGLYGIVRVATGDPTAALVSALLLISSSAYWSYIFEGGLYPRIVGMTFLVLFAFFATLYCRQRSRLAFAAMVLSLAASLSSHLLVGAIAVALAILIIALLPIPVLDRCREAFKLFVPTALLVAFFYLPYALTRNEPSPLPLFTREYVPNPLSALFVPGTPGGRFESLPLFLLPLAIALPVAGYVTHRIPQLQLARRLIVVVSIAAVVSIAYGQVGLPTPSALFLYAFQPGQSLFFAAFFLAALAGLGLGGLRLPRAFGAGAAAILLAFVLLAAPDMARGVINGDNPTTRQLQNALNIDPVERQFRIGTNWDGTSVWLGSRTGVPQTRGYQQQGVLHSDWQYWLETAVWDGSSSYAETNFLLDWYAVKWLYGGLVPATVQRFEARPDLYVPLHPEFPSMARTFEYLNAGPILSARSTRTALVIGTDESYALLLRALALSDFDSRSLITLRGGEYVDDHSAAELAQFDQVFLYGYKAHDLKKAFGLLNGYVQLGGSVFVEANNSPLETSDSAPTPIPGARVDKTRIGPDWKLEGRRSPITAGIDLAAFAPAVYQGGPWGISYIPEAGILPWAEPVLVSGGRPVMVAGALGRGRVVWSGMNLPYHAQSTRAAPESRLLAQAVAWAAPKQANDPAFHSVFVNPHERRIQVQESAAGVLLKENSFPNWHARVNGRSMRVYQAGPDFMYVPLGVTVTYPALVEIEFSRSAIEWLGDAISVVASAGLLLYTLPSITRLSRRWRIKLARSG